jgi:DNA polymerase-3 subunit chi
MTEVSFHFNVLDRTDYVCRLLRKATRKGANVTVTGPSTVLAHFDRALWTFDPLEFLPHVTQRRGQRVAASLSETKLWLVEEPTEALHHEVLVNLGDEPPHGFESFQRVIEIVSADEGDRSAARLRWKHYAARGYAIEKHEVAV